MRAPKRSAGGAPVRAPARAGFTLLELLMVVVILAIVGTGSLLLTRDTHAGIQEDLVAHEARQIREALLQFRRDTGFLPRLGPFALTSDPQPGRVPPPAQGPTWFHSPANFLQLFEEPLDATGAPVMPWDPDVGRGWRGPYLRQDGEGWVVVGSGLLPDGSGDPASGPLLPELPALADPFENPPAGPCFVWRLLERGAPLARHGRPYYLLRADVPRWARIVSSGPDGRYESQAFESDPASCGDDLVLLLR